MTRPLLSLAAALLLVGTAQAQTVVLVRHAEKATAPAADPSLTAEGRTRAAALAGVLKDARVSAILTSHLARTRETARPLSQQTGAPVTPVPLTGGLARYVDATAAAVRRAPKDSTVVVVAHSNTVPAIAKALGYAAAVDIPECRYDDLLILELGAGASRAVASRYGAASAC